MKSNVVLIDNLGNGFDKTMKETRKVAAYEEISPKGLLQMELCAEELLSLAACVAGDMQASFWIETDEKQCIFHLSTETELDAERRELLLSTASSGKNEYAGSFLGYIRDTFDRFRASQMDFSSEIPEDALDDLANHVIECSDPKWDGYEQSILRRIASCVKIGIRGDAVEIEVIVNKV